LGNALDRLVLAGLGLMVDGPSSTLSGRMRRREADIRFAQTDQFTGGSRGVGSALVQRIEFAGGFRGKPILSSIAPAIPFRR
jgi:hypothetical protein